MTTTQKATAPQSSEVFTAALVDAIRSFEGMDYYNFNYAIVPVESMGFSAASIYTASENDYRLRLSVSNEDNQIVVTAMDGPELTFLINGELATLTRYEYGGVQRHDYEYDERNRLIKHTYSTKYGGSKDFQKIRTDNHYYHE